MAVSEQSKREALEYLAAMQKALDIAKEESLQNKPDVAALPKAMNNPSL